ncbi:GAF domain-containing protein [Shewanella corallii]|uniref:GAF domain-containing protein n=2 Tax=Shewanella TaxID=22 RepID=A0ABT0N6X2_9GAMM|nr:MULTISPECIES: GAF domain-containing protein [Shewanella]MCL1037521.1 GAF domain-containing protein [Shewanella submarina]MCL2914193.1 GAF domain-containing protein [Shewanella corallii]
MTQVCYQTLNRQAEALLTGETNMIAAMANFSALVNEALPELNWVGFYIREGEQLVLGPFQGKVACARIPWGRGVCGTAAATNTTQLIDDVHSFEGHIACDSASNAEIVVPVRHKGEVVAVLDIDSPEFNRFDDIDRQGLEALVKTLESALFA